GFAVVGTHTYLEEAPGLTFAVSVADHGGTPAAGSVSTFGVADAALREVALTPPTNVVAGKPTPAGAVLYRFADDDPGGAAGDFTATVSWGDGTSNSSSDGTGAVKVVKDPSGGFDVVGSHTYLSATGPGTVDRPPLTFDVKVVDHSAATTDPHGAPVAVS